MPAPLAQLRMPGTDIVVMTPAVFNTYATSTLRNLEVSQLRMMSALFLRRK